MGAGAHRCTGPSKPLAPLRLKREHLRRRHAYQFPMKRDRRRNWLCRRNDMAALAFEVADLRRDLLRQQTHLEFRLAGLLSPASKDVMNLGQREPELFAFKNHLEMKPVAGIVPAIGAFPPRMQQAAVLIKPEGPAGHLTIPSHFPDRG